MPLIRQSKESDIKEYTDLLQRTYEDTYVDESIGLSSECFSKDVFGSEDTQKYLKSNLGVNKKQNSWLAFKDDKLIGSITITNKGKEYELRGFYVAPEHQGKGIGKRLWRKVIPFTKDKDIVFDIYAHNKKTIAMYVKWGFVVDYKKGTFYRHWPEWPRGVKAKCIYMRLRRGGKK